MGRTSSFSGIESVSVGMMCAARTSASSLPRRVNTFFKMASCSSTSPAALIRSWWAEKTSALARVILHRRERAFLHLALGIGKQLLGHGEGFLFHLPSS